MLLKSKVKRPANSKAESKGKFPKIGFEDAIPGFKNAIDKSTERHRLWAIDYDPWSSKQIRKLWKAKYHRMLQVLSKARSFKVENRVNTKISVYYQINKLCILHKVALKLQKVPRDTKSAVKVILRFKITFNNKSSSVDTKVNGQAYNKVHIFRWFRFPRVYLVRATSGVKSIDVTTSNDWYFRTYDTQKSIKATKW